MHNISKCFIFVGLSFLWNSQPAVQQISSTFVNSFWGVCTRVHEYENQHTQCMQIRNIHSTSMYHPTKSYVIPSNNQQFDLSNSFSGSVHVCTSARFMHNVRRSVNIPSALLYHLTKYNVISSNRLAIPFCKFILGVCARMHDYENPHARCKQIEKYLQYFKVFSYQISCNSVQQISNTVLQIHFGGLCTYARL